MFIIKNKKIFLAISAFLVLSSIIIISIFGLKRGIDFKGGALMEVTYTTVRPEISLIQDSIKTVGIGDVVAQESGETDLIVRSRDLTEAERVSLLEALSLSGSSEVIEKNYTSIGPSVGAELARKSALAIFLVVLAIVLFIAYAFRKVSEPVASWKYGLIAISTLAHDILIPSALFAILGKLYGAEVDTLFVVALLTVLGLSVSDTIVVFDRIRENLRNKVGSTFSETVGISLDQTYTRSINTSLTTILVLVALFFFGPETIKNFSLVLMVGMFVGTYSSIFVASPLLVLVEKWQSKK